MFRTMTSMTFCRGLMKCRPSLDWNKKVAFATFFIVKAVPLLGAYHIIQNYPQNSLLTSPMPAAYGSPFAWCRLRKRHHGSPSATPFLRNGYARLCPPSYGMTFGLPMASHPTRPPRSPMCSPPFQAAMSIRTAVYCCDNASRFLALYALPKV